MALVDYSILTIGSVPIPLSDDITVAISGGGDNIILTLTQSNNDNNNVNKEISLINSILTSATGSNPSLKLTICRYYSKDGVGSFFDYRLIENSFDKRLNEVITSITMTFTNDYDKSFIKDEVERSNTIKNITIRGK